MAWYIERDIDTKLGVDVTVIMFIPDFCFLFLICF